MVNIVSFGYSNDKLEEYASKSIEKQIATGKMTPRDGELIREFVEILKSENAISHPRAYKITNALSNLSRFIQKPYLEVTIGDLRAACNRIKDGDRIYSKNSTRAPGKKLSQNSQREYIMFLKRFYLWLVEEGYIDLPIDKIRKIKTPTANKLTKTASMMLSEDDIRKLLGACYGETAIRDKALISIIYEGALRIHEAALLKWGDVDFSDKRFVSINTAGKTGKPRYIPLPTSREYLASWKANYPEEITDEKPVFITTRGKSFNYQYLKGHLSAISEKAGVKHFVPHTLRHSRITNLARAGVSEISIKQLAWGDIGSNMFSTYAHLVNNDLDREILKSSGIDVEDKDVIEPLKPKACPRCYHINSPEKDFCEVCGCPLDKKTALELDEMKSEIHDDHFYQKIIMDLTAQVRSLETLLSKDPNINLKSEISTAAIPTETPTPGKKVSIEE